MSAPILNSNKCSVAIADYSTGHVRKKDFTIHKNGEPESDVYKVFENLNDAETYSLNLVKMKPEFECVIFDCNGKFIKTYDLKGER